MHKEHAYIGLGSNLGDSAEQLTSALHEMDAHAANRVLRTSSFYSSSPMGPKNQPNFVNAVCLIETKLSPNDLLTHLQGIENAHGRERQGDRWGPRTLDLDILLYGNITLSTKNLVIPHYGMVDREFVLVPLFEIAPNMVMPDGKPLSTWVANCSLEGLKRLPTFNQR